MNAVGLACLAALALTPGCALLNKSEPLVLRYFSPEPSAPPKATLRTAGSGLELRLGRVNADAYIKDRIVHRDSAFEVGYYDDRVWTEKPESYVRRALARALFDDRGLRQVLSGASLTLEVDVVAFEEVRAAAPFGRIALSYVLYDDRMVRLSRSVVVERPISVTKGADAASGTVQALSDALVAAVDSIAEATATELRTEEMPDKKTAQ
jgi:cholesterol transport system auxiliary component